MRQPTGSDCQPLSPEVEYLEREIRTGFVARSSCCKIRYEYKIQTPEHRWTDTRTMLNLKQRLAIHFKSAFNNFTKFWNTSTWLFYYSLSIAQFHTKIWMNLLNPLMLIAKLYIVRLKFWQFLCKRDYRKVRTSCRNFTWVEQIHYRLFFIVYWFVLLSTSLIRLPAITSWKNTCNLVKCFLID